MQSRGDSPERQWTILDIVNWTTAYFKSRDIDSPRATAEILLAHVLNVRRIDLYLRYDQPLTQNELSGFKALIQQRAKREPVAYIVGSKEFWSLDFCVSRQCLIPRPETECLVEAALALLPKTGAGGGCVPAVLELGTGSGAVIVAMAAERPGTLFFASDDSVEALFLAQKNAHAHRVEKQIHFFAGDWFFPLKPLAGFDMILSNPPYIRRDLLSCLQPEIFQYEPRRALDGGEDGLCCLRHIICSAHYYLIPGGDLILEIGSDQKAGVIHIARGCGRYEEPVVKKDYAGHDRVAVMKKKRITD
jgi:release factor glutamine methyltransferase